jgi:hypothetical protein
MPFGYDFRFEYTPVAVFHTGTVLDELQGYFGTEGLGCLKANDLVIPQHLVDDRVA